MAQPDPTPSRFTDLRRRTLSGFAVAAVAMVCAILGGWFWAGLMAAAGVAMMLELRSITLHGGGPSDRRAWPYLVAIPVPGALVLLASAEIALIAAPLILLAALFWDVRPLGTRDHVETQTPMGLTGGGLLMLGFVLAAVQVVHVLAVGLIAAGLILIAVNMIERARQIPVLLFVFGAWYLAAGNIAAVSLREFPAFGFLMVLWAGLVVVAADVGGYFAGRTIGGPKLWPAVSPKKTWAGLAGGVVLAFLVGGLFSWGTTGTYFPQVCAVSVVAAVLAQSGDLAESALKRRFGVKDAGTLIPGHGGVLDRLDGHIIAVLVAAAVTFSRDQAVFVW